MLYNTNNSWNPLWTDPGCRVRSEPWGLLFCSRSLMHKADSRSHWSDLALRKKYQQDRTLAPLIPPLQRGINVIQATIQSSLHSSFLHTNAYTGSKGTGDYSDALGRICREYTTQVNSYQQKNKKIETSWLIVIPVGKWGCPIHLTHGHRSLVYLICMPLGYGKTRVNLETTPL